MGNVINAKRITDQNELVDITMRDSRGALNASWGEKSSLLTAYQSNCFFLQNYNSQWNQMWYTFHIHCELIFGKLNYMKRLCFVCSTESWGVGWNYSLIQRLLTFCSVTWSIFDVGRKVRWVFNMWEPGSPVFRCTPWFQGHCPWNQGQALLNP